MGKCKKKLRNQVMCSGIVDFQWFVGGCASVTHLCSFNFFMKSVANSQELIELNHKSLKN